MKDIEQVFCEATIDFGQVSLEVTCTKLLGHDEAAASPAEQGHTGVVFTQGNIVVVVWKPYPKKERRV